MLGDLLSFRSLTSGTTCAKLAAHKSIESRAGKPNQLRQSQCLQPTLTLTFSCSRLMDRSSNPTTIVVAELIHIFHPEAAFTLCRQPEHIRFAENRSMRIKQIVILFH